MSSKVPEQYKPGFQYPVQDQDLPGLQAKLDPEPFSDVTCDGNFYKPAGKLQGKKAIITGADSGIGRAVAILYALEGADLTLSYLPQEKEDMDVTEKMIHDRTQGKTKVLSVEINLKVEDNCISLIQKHLHAHGGVIDILVLNHGVQKANTDIATLPSEQWHETFQTNVNSFFYMVKHSLDRIKSGGSIIFNASVNPFVGHPELVDYTATKGAIIGFMRALSNQIVGKRGIRVNAVAPGPIWTPLIVSTMTEEAKESFGLTTPIGRAGHPVEVATCFVFLASVDSSYISGQTLHPNGGAIIA
ncbi:NAD-P-binding protein [Dentipellis sp. KUC8613]|nr:NAD-P-binding protein [Dentipellis sp. KUC8613]